MKVARSSIVVVLACLGLGSALLARSRDGVSQGSDPQLAAPVPGAAAPQEKPGKIAVTAVEPSLDAAVDPRFGRCRYFVLVEAKGDKFETVKNTDTAPGKAGKQAAQLIAARGARVLLTGQCGPGAMEALAAAGIRVVPGCSGTVRSAIEKFRAEQ